MGYADMSVFTADAKEQNPDEVVRATYSSGKLVELTDQVEPESGDWLVVDEYTSSDSGLTLRRTNLFAQSGLKIVEETSIQGGKAEPFHVLSTTTVDGKQAEAPNVDMPDVPVMTSLSGTPFLAVISQMRKQSASKLCKAF